MKLKEIFYDEVYYYTDVFENAEEIISALEELDSFKESYPVIGKWKKDNSDRMIKHFSLMPEDWVQISDEHVKNKMQIIVDMMFEGINKVAKHFYEQKGLDNEPNIMPALHVCKYERGGGIGYHFDAERNGALLYTIAIYWNDEYVGGELGFQLADVKRSEIDDTPDEQKIIFKVKPEKGSVLIFPAQKPYFHASLELKEGIKYFTGSAIYVDGFDPLNYDHVKKYILSPDE